MCKCVTHVPPLHADLARMAKITQPALPGESQLRRSKKHVAAITQREEEHECGVRYKPGCVCLHL